MNAVKRVPKTDASSFHCSNSCESTSTSHMQYQHEKLTSKIKTLKTPDATASQETSMSQRVGSSSVSSVPKFSLGTAIQQTGHKVKRDNIKCSNS